MANIIKARAGEARILALLGAAEPALRLQFAVLVRSIQNTWTLDYIERLLAQGSVERAFEAVLANSARFASSVNNIYLTAGTSAADEATRALANTIARLNEQMERTGGVIGPGDSGLSAYARFQREFAEHSITVAFDQVNTRAVNAMRSNNLRLVQGFSASQRAATNAALRQGITEGINPRAQARLIRSSVGLTEYQQGIVNNYRNSLRTQSADALTRELRDRRFDPKVRASISGGRALTGDEIDRMTDAYAGRWRNFRAETIARTESMRAVHEGDREGWEQARDKIDEVPGLSDQLVRTWVAARDDRTRDSHAEMDGQEVGLDEPFVTPDGIELEYPGDPNAPPSETINCRCVVTTTFKAEEV